MNFQMCSHPECDTPLLEWITEIHCQNKHGMSKKEMEKKYGKIQNVTVKGGVLKYESDKRTRSKY